MTPTADSSLPVRVVPLLAALLLACVLAWPAAAQSPAEPGAAAGAGAIAGSEAESASADELQDLLATLKNDAEREVFVQRLEALIQAKRETAAADAEPAPESLGGQLLQGISARMDAVGQQLGQAADALERIPAGLADLWQGLQTPETRERWLDIAVNLLLILGGAVAAERLGHWALRRPRGRIESRANDSLILRGLFLLVRTLLDAVPIVAFAAAAYGLIAAIQPGYVTQLVAVTLINASVLSRGVLLLARAVLAPYAPGLRLPRMSDETCVYLYLWLRRVGQTAIYGYFVTEALLLLGVGVGTYAALQKLLGLGVAALVIVFLLQNRQPVARWLRGREPGSAALRGVRGRLAEMWHVLGVIYVLAVYGVWALAIPGGFEFLLRATIVTIAVLIAARVLTGALDRLIDRGFHLSDDAKARYPGLEMRANRYLPGLRRAMRIAVSLVAALLILHVWGAGVMAWLTSNVGQQVLGRGATVLLLLVLAFALWEVISAFIERTLSKSGEQDSEKRSARMATLLPLLRNAVRIVLIVVVSLIVLSEIGVDIGPLLAGAGVIGLAIGFGAQTLVKDVITGVFILVEDSLAVGDWVDLGSHSGGVESITVRTITLRDLHGHLHVVPFSDVTSILNMARDYGNAVIDIAVAYREDTDAVIKLLEQVAADLKQDPEWGHKITGELEVFGVNNLGDSQVEIRVRLQTKPLAHWGVRREFLRRTKQLFDREGVEIPFPHRTLYFGVDKDGSAPPARVAMQRPPREGDGGGAPAAPEQTSSSAPGSAEPGS